MSPRAAWRLERLGFGPVYDYVAGKVEWMAAGLRTVRAEPLDPLLERMAERGVEEVLVTAPEGRLLGVIHGRR